MLFSRTLMRLSKLKSEVIIFQSIFQNLIVFSYKYYVIKFKIVARKMELYPGIE
ncbi:MAG: hypothetical protein OEZ34_15770 [Spirochaetia bacterium]|nr:hypothetical protein [Spirochaetia bacterium]